MKIIKQGSGYENSTYELSTGKTFEAYMGRIVIHQYREEDPFVQDGEEGGNSAFSEEDFTEAERREIAGHMIGLWSKWGGIEEEEDFALMPHERSSIVRIRRISEEPIIAYDAEMPRLCQGCELRAEADKKEKAEAPFIGRLDMGCRLVDMSDIEENEEEHED